MATTTIQVRDYTAMRLRKIMERTKTASYDEAISRLIETRRRKSMAGALAGGKKWTTEEILDGLRDKVDRI
ncbi:MAG: hypothetical protein HY544_04220 [Candidatus Diapherotrites archaeon]|uniref:Antitoxin n=1 Tax=Candidatus Iainarchaeum sp. TaxID=3101447 RepID=A0A8T3YKB5_9ARCH|nr:hypothetical protein [Candidatus Diapherotrites archaeon]